MGNFPSKQSGGAGGGVGQNNKGKGHGGGGGGNPKAWLTKTYTPAPQEIAVLPPSQKQVNKPKHGGHKL